MSELIFNPQFFSKNNRSANPLYRNTHSMILYYSDKYKDYRRNAIGTKELIKKMKTKNLTKFYNNRQKWDKFSYQIPIDYMEALGITEKMIATTIEMDQEIYDKEISKPVTYDGFTQSMFFFTKAYPFERPLTEVEAIAEVKSIILMEGFQFFGERYKILLHRSPYYDIWFYKNGKHLHSYHRPDYRKSHLFYEFRFPYTINWRF